MSDRLNRIGSSTPVRRPDPSGSGTTASRMIPGATSFAAPDRQNADRTIDAAGDLRRAHAVSVSVAVDGPFGAPVAHAILHSDVDRLRERIHPRAIERGADFRGARPNRHDGAQMRDSRSGGRCRARGGSRAPRRARRRRGRRQGERGPGPLDAAPGGRGVHRPLPTGAVEEAGFFAAVRGAAAGGAGANLLGHRRRTGDRDVGLEDEKELFADSLDLHEVLGTSERAVLLAVVDDAIGDLLADARQHRQLGGRGLVDVDLAAPEAAGAAGASASSARAAAAARRAPQRRRRTESCVVMGLSFPSRFRFLVRFWISSWLCPHGSPRSGVLHRHLLKLFCVLREAKRRAATHPKARNRSRQRR